MTIKRWTLVGLTVLLLLGTWPGKIIQAAPPFPQIQSGDNLLQNPGFEGYTDGPNEVNWTRDTFNNTRYREIYTPVGWITFWREGGDGDQKFGRPECKLVPNEPPFDGSGGTPKRIYSGKYAAFCFTFYRRQDAGFYQVVRNLPPGATVEASVYAHAWTCNDNNVANARSCGDPKNFQFQVGIDPEGGTDPWSQNIKWSTPAYYQDEFKKVGPLQVQVGYKGVVTLFLRAQSAWAFEHSDAYWDEASLKIISDLPTPTPTLEPPPATPESIATQPADPQSLPGGAVTHTIVEGDSLFGIALTYGVDIDQLRQLNAEALAQSDMLSIGQVIIVSLPAEATPTPTSPAPTATPEPTGPGSVCLLAYQDNNNDMVYQAEDESLLPDANFTLLTSEGATMATYTSDGMSEPYCLPNIPSGNYTLRQAPPPGYQISGSDNWQLRLTPGQTLEQAFGYTRANVTPTPVTLPSESENPANTSPDWMQPMLITGGVLVVLSLAAAAVYFFVLRRRK